MVYYIHYNYYMRNSVRGNHVYRALQPPTGANISRGWRMEKEKTEEKDKKLVKCSECNSAAYLIDANTHEIVCAVCGKKLY
jgi:uncharacterized paraquat-inducible protein A